jgi:hypothetical protein
MASCFGVFCGPFDEWFGIFGRLGNRFWMGGFSSAFSTPVFHGSRLLFFTSSSVLEFSSFSIGASMERNEAKRAEWFWWRERCVYNRVCSCVLFQGARLRGNLRTAYCMRAGVGGIESVVERGRDELSRVECCRNRWGSYYSFPPQQEKGYHHSNDGNSTPSFLQSIA